MTFSTRPTRPLPRLTTQCELVPAPVPPGPGVWLTCLSCCARSDSKDLPKLSSLGHYLKGSSATIGLIKVKDGCEKIQQYGKKEVEGKDDVDDRVCLEMIADVLRAVKADLKEGEKILRKFFDGDDYEEDESEEESEDDDDESEDQDEPAKPKPVAAGDKPEPEPEPTAKATPAEPVVAAKATTRT